MDVNEMAKTVQDALTVRRVYAEPYEKDGLTVIAAVRVSGGAGGGSGQEEGKGDPHGGAQQGEGGGFGVKASPAGALVIGNGKVRWVPAVDPARMIGAVAVLILAVGFARGWVVTRQAKARLIAG